MHVVLLTPVGISEKAVKIWNNRYYVIGRSIRSGSTENEEQSTEYMRGIMLRDQQVSVGPDLTLLRVIPYACWLCLSTGGAARTAPARPGQRRKLFRKTLPAHHDARWWSVESGCLCGSKLLDQKDGWN